MIPRSTHLPLLALLLACGGSNSEREERVEAPDLTAQLASDQSRAGFVIDEGALWGGVAAEAARGDVKIYNHKVRFAIQGDRLGDMYLSQGGTVVDADIVRPIGQPGRDLVDEWAGMAGLGRLLDPDTIEIVDDGRDSGVSVVRVSGVESPLKLIEGAIEGHGDILPDKGLLIEHTYTLEADSWLMKVESTVTATDTEFTFDPGDVLMGAIESGEWWGPTSGYAGAEDIPYPWNGYLAFQNEGAIGIFSDDGQGHTSAGLQILSELLSAAASFRPTVVLKPGESTTWTRYYGVGPDFAALTDEWLQRLGTPTETVSGVVEGHDGSPVAGARITVLVDDAPYTLAISRSDGSWSANVPEGANSRVVYDGRGTGRFYDLPTGWAEPGYLSVRQARDQALRSLESGAVPIPQAIGLGWSDGGRLSEPARLRVVAEDGLPFEVRLRPTNQDQEVDERALRDFPTLIGGWTPDGEMELVARPGTYEAIIHRGVRHERWVGEVELTAGLTANLPVTLPQAYETPPGWIWGDPHCHAGPSPDGEITMVERMLVEAGVGVQLHFGTDHDHVADYGPLLEPLGVDHVLNTVISTEMSPVARGHLNLYPLSPRGDLPNGGAWAWWRHPISDTSEQMAALRTRHGGSLTESGGFAIQSNHPDDGLLQIADWEPGQINKPDFYSDDFDAIEVANGGGNSNNLEMYLDLSSRGKRVTPTGVSDSHAHFSSNPGGTGTWLKLGIDTPADYEPNQLRRVMLDGTTIVSRGLFLDLSIDPGSTVVGSAELAVRAIGPTWIRADRLHLYRDGVLEQTVEADNTTFQLAPAEDASYVVVAEGDTTMDPVWSSRPWAMSAAIRVDTDGDGWTAPLPPLQVGE